MIYAVGTRDPESCRGGLYMVDVSDPANPTSPGCVSEDGYVHDAQCVVYTGPDQAYWGKEICFGYNEDTVCYFGTSGMLTVLTCDSSRLWMLPTSRTQVSSQERHTMVQPIPTRAGLQMMLR